LRLLYEAGGVTTTIMDDRMQRAPAFMFTSARGSRAFGQWLRENIDQIKAAAQTTTRSGKLQDIERYTAGRILCTRFNYTTGDAPGQNLTGKATQAAALFIATGQDAANVAESSASCLWAPRFVAEEWVESHNLHGRNRP
jgi:hydroxymethylglutaryl-CoA reductase (NADPH)